MYLFKWLVIIHSLTSISLAVLVNVTVDDTGSKLETGEEITYFPPNQWSDGPKCDSCSVNNDLNQTMIFNGTWHNGTANKPGVDSGPLFATVPFFGSAVYVYCVIANKEIFLHDKMDIIILIDTQVAGSYSRKLVKDSTFEYNVLVYSNQSLPQDKHVLTIQNGRLGGAASTMLLDYIVYSYDNGLNATTESPRPTSAASTPGSFAGNGQSSTVNSAGKIVGGVLGSIGGILLVLVAFLYHRQGTWRGPNNVSCLSALPPEHTSRNPVTRLRNWWHGSRPRSQFSFNPSLLVEPTMMNQEHASAPTFRRPPPITTVHPIYPHLQRPNSIRLFHPREVTPTPSLDPRNEPSQPLSIIEWQRRTQREANDVPPRLDVSDVDMSSYYDFSSDTLDPTPPPQPRLKRFAVVNR